MGDTNEDKKEAGKKHGETGKQRVENAALQPE